MPSLSVCKVPNWSFLDEMRFPPPAQIMIDLETMGLGPTAEIASIGASVFLLHAEPLTPAEIDEAISRHPVMFDHGLHQTATDFHVYVQPEFYPNSTSVRRHDSATVSFWADQLMGGSPEAVRLLSSSGTRAKRGLTLQAAMASLVSWIGTVGNLYTIESFWSCPASFDLPLLRSVFMLDCGQSSPWGSTTRCGKTAIKLLAGMAGTEFHGPAGTKLVRHNALHDCWLEIHQLQSATSWARRQLLNCGAKAAENLS